MLILYELRKEAATLEKQRLHDVLGDKLNLFYILAFLPLPLVGYYRYAFFGNSLGALIPLYGFFLLFIKKDKLSEHVMETNAFQRVLGVFIVLSSFFLYYLIFPFVPSVGFYGLANYTVYLFGLFFIFFEIPALKQGFTTFFLIVASALTGLAFRWIEFQTALTVPYYVYLFSSLLGLFGIGNTMPDSTTILLYPSRGFSARSVLPVLFAPGCIGVYSLMIFSIIIVVTMVETPVGRRTKLLWSAMGFMGVLAVNVIRLLIVVASMYFYGYDFGQRVHQVIGYVLFLSWLAVFLLLFTKRKIIVGKIQLVQRKVLAWL